MELNNALALLTSRHNVFMSHDCPRGGGESLGVTRVNILLAASEIESQSGIVRERSLFPYSLSVFLLAFFCW